MIADVSAILFDLDGTLVDSEPAYHHASRQVLSRHGVEGFSWREHQEFIGIGTRETLELLSQRYRLSAPIDQLLREKNAAYLELARRDTKVFPRMRALVETLREAEHPLIVASGSSRAAIEAVLDGTGLGRLLPDFVSAEEVPLGKPAPDVFLEAARRLRVPPTACVVVEDAEPGLTAARRAGMRCLYVPYRETGDSVDEHSREDEESAPRYSTEELVFPGGQQTFDHRIAYDWLIEK